ncbi:hypothetical protein Ahy_A05g022614 [Arachis hypogaea]|uniref:Protein FAR1-RELATED SEQUENCE n=1 Tax=Arachis hypogaea TaxID=3818 RepID=A0A445D114_ARAHY|nr:hypothetical protein Ahy_A05g022614 [Arachis hypogaea]
MTIILFIILDINMAFVIDLNTQPSLEEIHSFDTYINMDDTNICNSSSNDMDDTNICNSSSNSATETECTTEVIIHPTISDEEIPKVGMLFGTLEEARQFYYNYANKVGFEPHIRNTNFDKNGRTPINQSIQCNRDGYRTKKNLVTQRSNTVSSVHCKARIYVKLDKELGKWRLSKIELAHTHRCDPSLSWMFKKNRELSMHVKDVIERNDQAGIRPSKTFQALADEAESFESSWYDFIEEYTLHDNNWLTAEFVKKCDCNLSPRVVKDNQYFYEVTQQKIVKGMSIYSEYEVVFCPISHQVRCNCFRFESYGILCCHILSILSHCRVDKVNSSYILSRWSKNVYRKHTHIRTSHDSRRSDESMNIFRGLCVDFYNVAQDFVHDKEEADILRSAFTSAKVALSKHRAKHSESMRTSECLDGLNVLQSPPHVVPRGRPSFKRLEADVDRKIKNGTKKRRASCKHTKEVAAVEGDKHSNKATERRITASKHPKDFAPLEEDCFTDNTISCIHEHFPNATNTQMDSLSSVGFTTLLNSFQNRCIHVRLLHQRTFYLKLHSSILC